MYRLVRWGGVALALLFFGRGSAFAQRPAEPLCLSPGPLARCERFMFFDAALLAGLYVAPHTLVSAPTPAFGPIRRDVRDLGTYGAGIVGLMWNRDSTHAMGASFEFGYADAKHPRVSAKVHRRTWFSNTSAIDISAGPLAAEVERLDDGPTSLCVGCLTRAWSYGLTGDVAVAERHGLGVVTGADLISGNGRTSFGLHAGARTEGGSAILVTAIALLLGAAAYYLVAGNID